MVVCLLPIAASLTVVRPLPPPPTTRQAIYRDVSRGLKDIYFKDRAQPGTTSAGPGAAINGGSGQNLLAQRSGDYLGGGGGGAAGGVGAGAIVSASDPSAGGFGGASDALAEFKLLTDEGPVRRGQTPPSLTPSPPPAHPSPLPLHTHPSPPAPPHYHLTVPPPALPSCRRRWWCARAPTARRRTSRR